MRRLVAGLIILALLLGSMIFWMRSSASPQMETLVASSLKSLQEQNRLTAFAARFVTVVTSRRDQLGFSAEKTLIMPAMVRYEIDLAKLEREDLDWNGATKTLKITVPPVEISGPEFDLRAIKEYKQGAVLLNLTDAERMLDQANRNKAVADVLAQAKAEATMRLARDASARAVARSFAMPLAAAGIEANVQVEFQK